jgi:serine/threonine protein kinase
MDAPPSLHPTDQTLLSYGLGKLDDSQAEAVDEHLRTCPDCRRRARATLSAASPGHSRATQAPPGSTADHPRHGGTLSNPDPVNPTASDFLALTLPEGLADHPDYEIVRELGRGGMGVVYLARNRLMDRDEVLKVMGRHIMELPGLLDRFLREIRTVAKLRHPNIVSAYHATRIGQSVVFAMEYVPGFDLSKMCASAEPRPPASNPPRRRDHVQDAAIGDGPVDAIFVRSW